MDCVGDPEGVFGRGEEVGCCFFGVFGCGAGAVEAGDVLDQDVLFRRAQGSSDGWRGW